jgi:hypothetical protein
MKASKQLTKSLHSKRVLIQIPFVLLTFPMHVNMSNPFHVNKSNLEADFCVLILLFLTWGSHYIAQMGLKLLGSTDPPET